MPENDKKRGEGKPAFDARAFLSKVNGGRTLDEYGKHQVVYQQGDPADAFFISIPEKPRSPWCPNRARKRCSRFSARAISSARVV